MLGFFKTLSADFKAVIDRDPAARGVSGMIEIVLSYPGFHALLSHRICHRLNRWGLPVIPRLISQFARFVTGIEIHPGAQIGSGFFIDHGMGVVIGETAIVGNGVTLYQGVTLGGTGKQTGKRHPTIGNNVVVGAGAKVLGNITVGDDAMIGAGSVVIHDVPPGSTVVGVPGQVVRRKGRKFSQLDLDHTDLPDPVLEKIAYIQSEMKEIEGHLNLHLHEYEKLASQEEPDSPSARPPVSGS